MIITTRYECLLKIHECCKVYRIEELNRHESLELFSWHAFGQDNPVENYLVDSERAVEYCRGLPLAIKTLGSSLSGKSGDVWKSQLQKLKEIPNNEILEKLKISYDFLQDDHDKGLFLDIACFFVGKDKEFTITILDGCDYYSLIGIQNLIDRNLLTVDTDNKLVMHQLIQEMGREIVRQESPKELGERSRLWNNKDSFHVLKQKTGTRNIRGLVLDMHFVKEDRFKWNSFGPLSESYSKKRKRCHFEILSGFHRSTAIKNSNEVVLDADAFAGMCYLQLLQISGIQLCGNYKTFPKELRWLYWPHCPLQLMPNGFSFERLVALQMPHSCLKKFFNGTKCLVLLKILDLGHSYNLSETPDFSMMPNLERLVLENCTRLVKVNESIGLLERLVLLNLRNCQNLRKLPKTICMLKSLATLDISGCLNLEKLLTELGNMDSLTVLFADGTVLNQLLYISPEVKAWHFSIWPWPLNPRRCPDISWVSFPRSLVSLSLANCNLFDDSFPREFGNLSSLQILNLSENPFRSLPSCINDLDSLQILWLESCPRLQSLNGLRQNIKRLAVHQCKLLEKISFESLRHHPSICRDFCMNLLEAEGTFKSEPLESVNAELINSLGLCNLETMDKTTIQLVDHYFIHSHSMSRKEMLPPQGLHERHTFYSYLRGSKIPSSFNLKSIGSSISFAVPYDLNFRIQGLSVCFIYALSKPNVHYFSIPHTIISNATRHLKWSYCPRFFGIPKANEDYLYLSYWKFEDLLEGGDELNISIVTSGCVQVKEVGVRLVYKEAEENKSTSQSTNLEVVPPIHPYGKVVPGCCNGNCMKCKNYPVPVNSATTRVILLGNHSRNCSGCPEGYLVWHHARMYSISEPLLALCKKFLDGVNMVF